MDSGNRVLLLAALGLEGEKSLLFLGPCQTISGDLRMVVVRLSKESIVLFFCHFAFRHSCPIDILPL